MADKEKTKVQDSNGTFGELKFMVTDYAKQQTVEPLKNLGKWAAFGVAGGLLLTIGAFLTGLGFLRLFQKMSFLSEECALLPNEGGASLTCDTTWTFVPYLMVFGLLIAAAGACFYAMTKTPEWMDDDA